MEEKIDKLIDELTLEGKALLCSGSGWMSTESIDRLEIPSIKLSDGPHGIRLDERAETETENEPTTCFPTASAIASSWNVELTREMGRAIGRECQNLGINVLLAPSVNIKRTPLGGRNFEYYSEDPHLTGEMGAAFVDGVQSQGVGTSVKHFACNNHETDRMNISVEIDERPLREIYLSAFRNIVQKTQPWTVMCSYNKLNGTYTSEHPRLLTEILRGEWGFDGPVVSDWGAVNNRVDGIKAGMDLEMPGPSSANDQKLLEAVKSGELDESVLDQAVERTLKTVFKAVAEENPEVEVDGEAHHELARKAASESIVLLKNEGGLLPLDIDNISSLAVIGRTAEDPPFQGGGSSEVNVLKVDIPLEKIKEAVSDKAQVSFARGYPEEDRLDSDMVEEALDEAKSADAAVLFVGLLKGTESEGYDRQRMRLPENQIKLIQEVEKVQPNTVVVLTNGSPVRMTPWVDDVPALLETWLAGQAGAGAIADVLFGEVNPSGKLAETFPAKLSDNPSHVNFPGENGKVLYGEGLFVGYRYYDEKEIEPLFPFGYGLSYTTFEYSDLELSKDEIEDTDELKVSLAVTNTGELAGKEVVQLYVSPDGPRLVRPKKELKSFKKVTLDPEESKTVSFTLNGQDFSCYDPIRERWVVETGDYDILVGSSSRDIELETTLHLESTQPLEKILREDSSLYDWLKDERGRKVIEEMLPEEASERLEGVEEWMKNIPLKKLVLLSQGRISEEVVESMTESLEDQNPGN